MTIDLAFNIALSLIASLAGLVIKNLYTKIAHDRKVLDDFKEKVSDEISKIKVEYLPKSDLNRTQDQIVNSIKELTRKIDKLDDKISQKADK